MKKIILFNVAFSVLLLLSSCKKAKENYSDYLPKVKAVSATVQMDGSVVVKGELEAEGEAAIRYIGFCCDTKALPEMPVNQQICELQGNSFSVTYPQLSSDSSYYFRAWATNYYGYSYSNEVFIDSVVAPTVTPPCSLVMNKVTKDGTFTHSIYAVSEPVYDFNTGYTVTVDANTMSFSLVFGSPITNGLFTTYAGPDHPGFRQVYVDIGYPNVVNPGSTVYVNTISPGVFDVTICDGPWVSGSTTLHFKSRFTIPL